jgi:hypothetical protein
MVTAGPLILTAQALHSHMLFGLNDECPSDTRSGSVRRDDACAEALDARGAPAARA